MEKSPIQKALEFMESPEGQIHMKEMARKWKEKEERKQIRVKRVEEYLKTCDFDKLIQRLASEHDEAYKDKCYAKGYEPYPNHKLSLLFDFLEENYTYIQNDLIPQDFLGSCWFYKGYWFTIYCGQGCFYRIYDSNINHVMQT